MRHRKASGRARPRAGAKRRAAVREAPVAAPHERCPVVGIGASAGGLAAFEAFFEAMPPESGAAFVLIQHLDPTRESLTAELVAKHTHMPVVQVERDMSVEPNHVYVIPPNKYLSIADGRLQLTAPGVPRGARMPIDLFLRSLASDRRERAVGIILSGTGTDGTHGLKEVQAAGGLTMTQTPESAPYDGMPRSAIAMGGVDEVLPVEAMPALVLRYLRHAYVSRERTSPEPAEAADDLGAILAILRSRSKLDFGGYKKGTLRRRIQRRMSLRHVARMSAYAAELRRDADEVRALGQDLLIGVTSFFRDPAAWQALEEEVIAPLVERTAADHALRVWVPGCASGEEAYSLAMLLIERLGAARKSRAVQVFASDLDDVALEVARAGVYPASIAADVSPERLRRFFVKEEHGYRVKADLRDAVTCAHQNLLSDPPFSRLDLVSCRNLLMYLEPAVQEKVLTLLHFALVEGGYLFLGTAETIGEHHDLFATLSKKWRIYRRIGPTRRDNVDFPVFRSVQPGPVVPPVITGPPTLARIAAATQQLLLARHAPASVVINRKGEILHFSGPTENYLVQPPGAPTQELFAQARDGLQTQLRAAVHRVMRDRLPVSVTSRPMRRGTLRHRVKLSVEPLTASRDTEDLFLVSFEDDMRAPRAQPAREPTAAEESVVRQLDAELKATREELRGTIEQLETANEELKTSNEEVMSANEELQSINEELQTSKEELQSLNEELNTINAQLQSKVDELEQTNNDLDNLLTSTNLATIFLDPNFRIRRFTPEATKLFNLIPSDLGRPLADIVQKFADPDVLHDAGVVLEKLVPVRKEVETHDGRWYMRETLPYRTRDDRIGGVVITFSGAARDVLREARLRTDTIVDAVHDSLLVLDSSLRVMAANRAFCETFRTTPAAIENRRLFTFNKGEWNIPALRSALQNILASGKPMPDLEVRHAFARIGKSVMLMRALALVTGAAQPPLILLAIEDLTERRRHEAMLKETEARGQAILATTVDAIISIDARGIVTSFNRAAERMFGYTAREAIGRNVKMLMPRPYRDEHDGYLARYVETGVGRIIGTTGREVSGRRKDGTTFPLELAVSEFHDATNPGFVGSLRDITQRKQAEEELRNHEAERARLLRISLVGELGAGLVHEVGQPLSAVVNTLEACATRIRAGTGTPKSLLRAIDEAIKEGLRAAEVVRNVRSLVRRQPPKREPTELRNVIEHASRLVASQLARHHVELRLALGDRPLPVRAAVVEIEQVVVNLLQNAVDAIGASRQRNRRREIAVSAARSRDGNAVEIAVRDSGIGIPEGARARLFDPFFTTKAAGVGMGLAICRSIIDAHGGRLWIAPGGHRRGATTIRFTLPLDGESVPARPRRARRAR